MKHNFPGSDAPEYAHTHGYGPIQSYPVNVNCPPPPPGPCDCGVPEPPPPPACSSPVPPPIPPVQYVPGMDVQEQLCNMANRVNVCINRWNDIQRNCYQALDQVVGAAVNNDVYYAPDEVRYTEGYDADSGCAYGLVVAKAVDRAGNPIFCHLRPAFNNQTNSGAREKITDVSFVTSAQMAMTALQATETQWKGTTVFNCNPGYSNPDDTIWVAGWNRNGVLRFFQGDVSQDVLRQNRMVNCIGPVFPCVYEGQIYEAVVGAMGTEPGAIQAMGWMQNGNKVFFSCGVYEDKGMSPAQAATVLMNMGCRTAVITSYQTAPASDANASPQAGTNSTLNYANDTAATVEGVPGMTGGMVYLGQLSDAPIGWSIPSNCAAWYISKRPPRGWRNSFTTEVANIVQQMGNQQNYMSSIMGQLDGDNQTITQLQAEVTQNTNNVAALQNTVGGFDTRIKNVENGLYEAETTVQAVTEKVNNMSDALAEETATREDQVKGVQAAAENETTERKAADAALQAALTQETSARKSADTILQNNIDAETALRDAQDKVLSSQISTEIKDRTVADINLANDIKAETAAREAADEKISQDIAAIESSIEDIQDGKNLPLASKTQLGIVKIGDNLNISEDGTLSGMASSGGDVINAGDGITITETTDGTKTVAVNTDTIATNQSVTDKLAHIQAAQTDASQKIQELETKQNDDSSKLDDLTTKVEAVESGEGLPVASATTLGGVKIGANLSISADGVLSASAASGEGGDTHTATAGEGINVEYSEETHVYTVSLDQNTRDTLAEVPTIKENVETNTTDIEALQTSQTDSAQEITAIKAKDEAQDTAIEKNASDISVANTVIQTVNTNAVNANTKAEAAQTTADEAKETAEKVDAEILNKVDKTGDTMTGDLTLEGAKLVLQAADGTVVGELAVMDGVLTLVGPGNGSVVLRGLAAPLNGSDAVPKSYVDSSVSGVTEAANQAATDAANANATALAAKTTAEAAQEAVGQVDPDNFVKITGDTMSGPLIVQKGNTLFKSTLNRFGLSVTNADSLVANIQGSNQGGTIYLQSPDGYKKILLDTDGSNIIIKPIDSSVGEKNWVLGGVADPILPSDAANKDYVDSVAGIGGSYLPLSGGTLSGPLTINNSIFSALIKDGKIELKANDDVKVQLGDGNNRGTIKLLGNNKGLQIAQDTNGVVLYANANNGDVSTNTARLAGVSNPTFAHDAANKAYVDSKLSGGTRVTLTDTIINSSDGSVSMHVYCVPGVINSNIGLVLGIKVIINSIININANQEKSLSFNTQNYTDIFNSAFNYMLYDSASLTSYIQSQHLLAYKLYGQTNAYLSIYASSAFTLRTGTTFCAGVVI